MQSVWFEEAEEQEVSVVELCSRGDLKVLSKALEEGSDPNERDRFGQIPLHYTAIRGRDDLMRCLLQYGAEIAILDHHGNSALHHCGHKETVECLLEYGIHVNIKNKKGLTALNLMQRRGVEESAIKLLEDIEEDIVIGNDDSLAPLLQTNQQRYYFHRKRGLERIQSVWLEFCMDLGAERLVLVLISILMLSLYVAYMITGFSKHIDTRIPIDIQSVEL